MRLDLLAVPRHPGAVRAGRPSLLRRWLVAMVVWAGLVAGLGVLGGCASTGPAPVVSAGGAAPVGSRHARVPKGYYRVRAGDSLGGIAERRQVPVDALIRWNSLTPPYRLYPGRVLRVVPPRARPAPVGGAPGRTRSAEATPRPRSTPKVSVGAPPPPGSRAGPSALVWAWPLQGAIQQGFRAGDPARPGLRISCRPGVSVRAAAAGRVAYSGSGLKGYGNLIIVKHNKNYLSAYGFNRRLFVREGDSVSRGQPVAECGEGPGGVALLHFEVRRDGAAVDPLLYLPPRE